MKAKRKGNIVMGIIFGLLVAAAGVILLLKSLGVHTGIEIQKFWPVLVIAVGLSKIINTKAQRRIWSGLVITGIGTLFLLSNLQVGGIHFGFKELWPVLIILAGIAIVKHSLFGKGCCHKSADGSNVEFKTFVAGANSEKIDSDFFDISAFLGAAEHVYDRKTFKGGRISGTLGGCEIDLRNAEMEGDSAVITISAFMAGIELYIPANWKVVVESSAFMAGIDNKTRTTADADKTLFIKGSAFMAGIEIKN